MLRLFAIGCLAFGFSSPAWACIEFIPQHPDVLSNARTMFEGVVQSRNPRVGSDLPSNYDWVLMLRVTKRIKGYVGEYAFIPTTPCAVPPLEVGTSVTAFRFAEGGYMVVRNRATNQNPSVGR